MEKPVINKKLLVVAGPTATGKTSLAIELAQRLKGELVNADSRQVYRGMDVGTGKDLNKFSIFHPPAGEAGFQFSIKKRLKIGYYLVDKVPIWLLDIVEPDYRFNVSDYLSCALPVIDDIWRRGKLPILVGGTGFYIKALLDGIETLGIKPDWQWREKARKLKLLGLQEMLRKINPERFSKMNQSDRNNPRRLIRAIEVERQLKKLKIKNEGLNLKKRNLLIIGLKAPYRVLYERIDKRVEKRLKQGLLAEIEGLLRKGYGFQNSVLGTTLAYKEWQEYFEEGSKSAEVKRKAIERWKYDEHRYARRQMTWFRKEKRINWFDITQKNFSQKVEKMVRKWYINSKLDLKGEG